MNWISPCLRYGSLRALLDGGSIQYRETGPLRMRTEVRSKIPKFGPFRPHEFRAISVRMRIGPQFLGRFRPHRRIGPQIFCFPSAPPDKTSIFVFSVRIMHKKCFFLAQGQSIRAINISTTKLSTSLFSVYFHAFTILFRTVL